MTWTAALCDSGGVAQRDLPPPFTFRRELNRTSLVKVPLPLDSAAAYVYYELLAAGLPQARLYQGGALRLSGLWAPPTEEANADGADAGLEFRDPFDLLSHRHTAAAVTKTAVDAGQIALQLIAATDGYAKLAPGAVEATVARTLEYDRAVISDAIVALTEFDDGFDFTIVPLDPSISDGAIGRFDVQAHKGSDRETTVILEQGPDTKANAQSVQRTVEYPVNRVILVGEAITSTVNDVDSQARYGVWELVETHSDITNQAALDAKATGLLRPNLVTRTTFTPEPSLAPVPFVEYDVGDTITVRSRVDSLLIDEAVRVTAIEVDIDSDGIETGHRIEFGDERPLKPQDSIRALRRRVARLEAA